MDDEVYCCRGRRVSSSHRVDVEVYCCRGRRVSSSHRVDDEVYCCRGRRVSSSHRVDVEDYCRRVDDDEFLLYCGPHIHGRQRVFLILMFINTVKTANRNYKLLSNY